MGNGMFLLKDEAEVGTAEASASGSHRLVALAVLIARKGVLARYECNASYNDFTYTKGNDFVLYLWLKEAQSPC